MASFIAAHEGRARTIKFKAFWRDKRGGPDKGQGFRCYSREMLTSSACAPQFPTSSRARKPMPGQ